MEDDSQFTKLLGEIAAAPAETPLSLEPALPRRLGRYRLVERIGQGGMGVVYRAHDHVLRREVALKLPGSRFRGAERQRLMSEARRAAAFDHPNIAKVYDAGEIEGEAFIAMEFVRGDTLRATLQRGRLREAEALRLLLPIARALAHTHERGIVHRDLKPENVMVEPAGGVKVLDFGLAQPAASPAELALDGVGVERVVASLVGVAHGPDTAATQAAPDREPTVDGSAPTSPGSLGWELHAGTPGYMSPEQQRSRSVGCAADVFAFGVIAHEMMTGRAPHAPEPPGAASRPTFSAAARALITACLSASDGERPRDGAALEAAVLRLQRSSRRLGGPLAISAAALASLTIAGLWSHAAAPPEERSASASPGDMQGGPSTAFGRLTALHESTEHHAYLAPSGKELTFVDERGLMLLDLSSGARTRLLPPEARVGQAHWLPGERELVLLIDSGALPAQLERLELATLKRTPIAASVKNEFAISPDGTRLASVVEPGSIELSSLATGAGEQTLAAPGAIPGGPLAWSPDGQWIALHDALRAPSAIVAVHTRTGELRDLVQHGGLPTRAGGAAFAWHASGQLTYQLIQGVVSAPGRERGNDERTGELWTARVDPQTLQLSARRLVSREPIHAVWMQGDAEGDRVLLQQEHGQENVLGARLLAPGRLETGLGRLTHRDVYDRIVGFYRGQLGLLTTLEGERRLALTSLEDGSLRPWLQPGDMTQLTMSLGDRGFLFYRQQPSASMIQLWRQPEADGAAPVLVSTRDRQDDGVVHYCAAQAQRCFEARHADDEWQLAELSLADGSLSPTFSLPGLIGDQLAVAPDALSWAAGRSSIDLPDPTVRFYDAHGQLTASVDLPEGCFAQNVAFSPDGSGVYATAMCTAGEVSGLFFVERAGRVQRLWSQSSGWLHNPAVSPDGQWLVVNQSLSDRDLWTLDLPRVEPASPKR